MTVFTKKLEDSEYRLIRDIYMSSLSGEEFAALECYTSSTYKEINQYMMEGRSLNGEKNSYTTIISRMNSAIEKNNLNITIPALYRGTKQKYVAGWVEGMEVQFPFFLSASTDPVIASRFAGDEEPVVLVIKGVGSKYALTSLTNGENEVVISPDSRFSIERIRTGVDFQAEYDNSGFHAPVKKNVTVVELTVTY